MIEEYRNVKPIFYRRGAVATLTPMIRFGNVVAIWLGSQHRFTAALLNCKGPFDVVACVSKSATELFNLLSYHGDFALQGAISAGAEMPLLETIVLDVMSKNIRKYSGKNLARATLVESWLETVESHHAGWTCTYRVLVSEQVSVQSQYIGAWS